MYSLLDALTHMEDIGLPFDGPVPMAEDNSATHIIAHIGKITHNY
jgi:hypothetical protein